jgi:hypothetical protein
MPKASLLTKDFVETGLGFGEGWGVIREAKCIAYQFPPSKDTGKSFSGPECHVELAIERSDEKGKGTGDITSDKLKVGDLESFRPGLLKSPDDAEPKDLGDSERLDTYADWGAGNSIFSTGEQKMNRKSKFPVFMTSLQECGFKPEVLARCYLPDMVGTVAHFTQNTVKQDGKKDRDGRAMKDYQCLIVDKITVYPYEGKAASKTAAKSTGKANGAPATETAPASDDAEAIAEAFIKDAKTRLAGKTTSVKRLEARTVAYCADKEIAAKVQATVAKLVTSLPWMEQAAEDLGFTLEGDSVTFA